MLRLTNAGNTMTFSTITNFNQLQWKPQACMASPLPPYWAVLQRNSFTFRATPGSDSGSTSACLWPWREETPSAYWHLHKFDLILATLSALTSVPYSCSSVASFQWMVIAFRMSVFSVSFIAFGIFFMPSVKPTCSIVLFPFSSIMTNLILFIFPVNNTTVSLFTVKPFCILSLPLSVQPRLGVLHAWWNIHNGGTPSWSV